MPAYGRHLTSGVSIHRSPLQGLRSWSIPYAAPATGWAALVVHVPFEGAVAMEWVPAERVEPIADPAPQER